MAYLQYSRRAHLTGTGMNFRHGWRVHIVGPHRQRGARGIILGVNETCVALIAALSSFFGGVILAFYGWQAISTLRIGLLLAIILFFVLYRRFGQADSVYITPNDWLAS